MWLTRATRAKEKEGQELRLYNDGANDGVFSTGPQSFRSSLLALVLATAKDIIRCPAKKTFSICVEAFHFTWSAPLSFLYVYPLHASTRATKVWGDHSALWTISSKVRAYIEKPGFCRFIESKVAVLYGILRQLREPGPQYALELQ